MKYVIGSILDFPRKELSKDIWQYPVDSQQKKIDELPHLKSSIRYLIESTAKNYLAQVGLTLHACNLYGGAASYQWSEGADIDVSLYAEGWHDNIDKKQIEKYQDFFSNIKIPYKSYEIHFFLKEPNEKVLEVADAVYDVINDEWVLPPLVLPNTFDPDEYFKPFLKHAEAKAKKFDEAIGKLRRSWSILTKAAEAKNKAAEPDLVEKRIEEEKTVIDEIITWLSKNFIAIRDKRYAMHDALREKMKKNIEVGRFERFQEPEIVWKYLDRAGYNDFLWKLYKLKATNQLNKILNSY